MSTKTLKVLFIEDDPVDRMAFERYVTTASLSYEYTMADSFKEGKKKLTAHTFDVVIVDYLLGDGTAFDLLEIIEPDTPVIVVTGAGDEDVAVKAIKQGAMNYLVKDLKGDFLKTLHITILKAIQVKKTERDLAQYHQHLEKMVKERTLQLQQANDQLHEEIAVHKRLKKQLLHAQKMEAIGTLAGGIAHDFNNILSAIIGYTELAVEQVSETDSIRSDLVGVLQAGIRAKNLVRQILTISRQNDIQEYLNVKLYLIVTEALKLLRSSLPSTIEIRQKISDKGMVLADPTQMHQVVMNLCTNAYQAMMEKGGTLDVTLSRVDLDSEDIKYLPHLTIGPHLLLSIKDTGCGIKPDTLERIFNPYFTTKEKEQGTGLGLAVVHGIVDNHKGAIKVYSELNQGTSFLVYLPRVEAPSFVTAKTQGPPPMGDEKILYVDDEKVIVRIADKMIKTLGYDVETATDSMDALGIFKKNPDKFDLVITDMTMPKMTGDRLAQKLMQIRPDIPIILCTGLTTRTIREKALEIGIKVFLMKPFVNIDLAKAIRRALDN